MEWTAQFASLGSKAACWRPRQNLMKFCQQLPNKRFLPLVLVALQAGAATVLLQAGPLRPEGSPRPPQHRDRDAYPEKESSSKLPTAASQASPSAQSLFDQGLEDLQRARYEQAIGNFRQALEFNPALVTARYDLGVAYFALGKFEEARGSFEEVRGRDPQHRFAAYFLARLDLMEGNLDSAIRGFRALSGPKPIADELYYLASAYFRKGDTQQAIRVLERAAASKTGDYRVHLLLARAYRKAGRPAEADRQLGLSEKLREAYRVKSREILECQGLLASHLGNAVERCRQLLDGNDPTKLVSLGVLLAERQLYEMALPPLAKAARLDPENYEPQFNLGLTYFKMKKYQDARKPLEAAVALRPESYEAVALLGSVLFALGEDYNAARQLRHAHQLRPGDEKVKTLLFEELKMIAQHLLASQKYKESVPFFEEALSLKPDAAGLRSQLSQAYSALGNSAKPEQGKKATGAPRRQAD